MKQNKKTFVLHPALQNLNPRVKAIIEIKPIVSPILRKLREPPTPQLVQPKIGAGLPTTQSSAVLEFISFNL
jgi:hypothetical protein